MKNMIASLSLSTLLLSSTVSAQTYLSAARALIRRIVPAQAGSFVVEPLSAQEGKDQFEIISIGDKIHLRGNNGVAIASALYYYLKEFCQCQVTWNGSNLHLPAVLPSVNSLVKKVTPYNDRYYLNYCTFNYSMSWWDWDRWQQEIDWMALHGINMPLAITGQAWVWQQVYRELGFSDADLAGFFSGPAYFAWFYMGNLDGWGGPLPRHWIESHRDLQKKILDRERSLGMRPVLPAFTGHVPASFAKHFPQARLKKTNWNGSFSDVFLLDPEDPLFTRIGKLFIEKQTEEYGTDHLYSADTFNENIPPSSDSSFLESISARIYDGMRQADRDATWVMQAWLFHYQSYFWKLPQIEALLKGVPNEHMILLDLYTATYPMWNSTKAYFGKPWIWNLLHNFGGNITMYGRMDTVAAGPAATLRDPDHGLLTGIGICPEAIEQNPVLYELMADHTWRNEPIDLNTWLPDYIKQRYGYIDSALATAWQTLRFTVYNGGKTEGGPESIITGRPTFDASTAWTRTQLDYSPQSLLPVWKTFLDKAKLLENSDGFRYDLVDITRQVLANYADSVQQLAARQYKDKNLAGYEKTAQYFLSLIDDMDQLLGTRTDFLLGKWLADARARGITEQEKDLYEFNARDLITLWGNKDCSLHDYSCRQWSGLLKGFYRKRWEQFFSTTIADLRAGRDFSQENFEEKIRDWEWKWVNSHEKYPAKAQGNPVEECLRLYHKYHDAIASAYRLGDENLF